MKQKKLFIYLALLLPALLVSFFEFGMIPLSSAASCGVTVQWRDPNGQNFSTPPTTATVGQTYYGVATYYNCIGAVPSLVVSVPGSSSSQGLGAANISGNPEERNATIWFSQPGTYYFTGVANISGTGQYTSQPSSAIVASAATSAAAAGGGGTSSQSWACAVNTGASGANGSIWSCESSPTNSSCTDISDCTGSCTQIASSLCNQPTSTNPAAAAAGGAGTGAAGAGGAGTGASAAGGAGVPPKTNCQTNPNPNNCLTNPIPGATDLTSLLINIMKGFLGIVAVWAVAFIVIGGFKMVISQGNEEAVTSAKKTIIWAVLGLLVAVLSFAIIAIVQNLVGVTVQAPTLTSITRPYDRT